MFEFSLPEAALGKLFALREGRMVPNLLGDAAIATVPLFGSLNLDEGDLLFDSVTGAATVTDVQLTDTPAGRIRYPMAIEISHTDAAAQVIHYGVRWNRAGAPTSVALITGSNRNQNNLIAHARGHAAGVGLGPGQTIYGSALAMPAGQLVLKMQYIELPLGAPPPF